MRPVSVGPDGLLEPPLLMVLFSNLAPGTGLVEAVARARRAVPDDLRPRRDDWREAGAIDLYGPAWGRIAGCGGRPR